MVDYSVWDHIEVSDDEDDTHPNIDTASLFRWRHQARVERMEQFEKEKEDLQKGAKECQKKFVECQKKMKDLEVEESAKSEAQRLQKEMEQLKKEEKKWQRKEEDLKKKEKNMPWNVDTLCKEGFSKVPQSHFQGRGGLGHWGLEDPPADCRFLMSCLPPTHMLTVYGKNALMEQVAHQTIVMQFILELAKSLKVDPRACFRQFFTKIK
ncbi:PREDICTED: hsp90 co-chaperone Cdc37, partial [Nanorana parkeri]|uniref:hsp90 co-chaperone Cdc37 n=1 Tax=Nanorana parkeri TaxID=125878 RepID=UPI0008545D78